MDLKEQTLETINGAINMTLQTTITLREIFVLVESNMMPPEEGLELTLKLLQNKGD